MRFTPNYFYYFIEFRNGRLLQYNNCTKVKLLGVLAKARSDFAWRFA